MCSEHHPVGQSWIDVCNDVPAGVIGLGKTGSRKELAEIYTAADVFVNPTHEDNYPTVNLEAIACGTPVVTYRTGGSVESIVPGTGHIVEQGDVKGLYAALQDIRQQDRGAWRRSCREYALRHFEKSFAI